MHPDYEDKLTAQAYVKRKKKGIPVFPSAGLLSRLESWVFCVLDSSVTKVHVLKCVPLLLFTHTHTHTP